MKILILSNSHTGGAGRAAYRLQKSLQSIHVDPTMMVRQKATGDPSVVTSSHKTLERAALRLNLFEHLEYLPLRRYPHRKTNVFSTQWFPDNLVTQIQSVNPDLVNLHWVNRGYLKIETVAQLKKPIVWTLHDMWAFTGGCHYVGDCDRYTDSCGACPQLGSHRMRDLSYRTWQRKAKAWRDVNITVVTPSHWLADCAKRSSLFKDKRIEVIPNGLDTAQYKPIEKTTAREILNLPKDKRLLLFGAMSATGDYRKGFHLIQPMLQQLSQMSQSADTALDPKSLEIVIFGASKSDNAIDLGFNTHYLGRLQDETSLALAYSAVDAFIAPSLEDNLPSTIMEASACGTPSIAFNIGGIPDLITHQQTGYLAKPFNTKEFAHGVMWVLDDEKRYRQLSKNARHKAEILFSYQTQAKNYMALFESVLRQ